MNKPIPVSTKPAAGQHFKSVLFRNVYSKPDLHFLFIQEGFARDCFLFYSRFMMRVFFCLFVVLSMMTAPLVQAYALDDHSHHRAHDMNADELDVDSEGNPHNNADHAQFSHNHAGDFYRAASGISVMPPAASLQTACFGQDLLFSDFCPGPLLEPPSHA